jgi:hypothetical protein
VAEEVLIWVPDDEGVARGETKNYVPGFEAEMLISLLKKGCYLKIV